jgi:hypothetical protein
MALNGEFHEWQLKEGKRFIHKIRRRAIAIIFCLRLIKSIFLAFHFGVFEN